MDMDIDIAMFFLLLHGINLLHRIRILYRVVTINAI